jgi:transcriptional regulator with XRE-family HTH domain
MLAIVSSQDRIHTEHELGGLIRRQRRERGLSQIELAEQANVARTAIQKLEEGRGTVTLDTAIRIVTALSLDLAVMPRVPAYGTLLGEGSAG